MHPCFTFSSRFVQLAMKSMEKGNEMRCRKKVQVHEGFAERSNLSDESHQHSKHNSAPRLRLFDIIFLCLLSFTSLTTEITMYIHFQEGVAASRGLLSGVHDWRQEDSNPRPSPSHATTFFVWPTPTWILSRRNWPSNTRATEHPKSQ